TETRHSASVLVAQPGCGPCLLRGFVGKSVEWTDKEPQVGTALSWGKRREHGLQHAAQSHQDVTPPLMHQGEGLCKDPHYGTSKQRRRAMMADKIPHNALVVVADGTGARFFRNTGQRNT